MDLLNSKIYRVFEVVICLILLDLIWLIACLPVITAWPATAAMFGVVREWINNADSDIVAPFARHFKANFLQSLWIGVLWLAVCGVLVADLAIIRDTEVWVQVPLFLLLVLVALCFIITSVYIFPVMVNYEGNWRNVIKNSFLIATSQPATTIICILVLALALVAVYFVPVAMLVAGSGTAYILYFLCRRAFNRIEAFKGANVSASHESETT